MPSLLERAARWQKGKFDVSTSVLVDYITGKGTIEGIKAIPGQSAFIQTTLEDTNVTSKSYDWIISAADLLLDAVKVEPATGHTIRYTLEDGRQAYYEVLPASESGRAFDVSDPLGVLYRVHSKFNRIVEP